MRAALVAPAVVLALLLLPAAAQGPDPLRGDEVLFLLPDGGMGHDAPEAAPAPAPMAGPGADSVAVWAHDAVVSATFAGDAVLTVPVEVALPAVAAPPRALFTVSLLKAGEAVATAEVGPEVLLPGTFDLEAALPALDVAFAAGDSIGLSIALHMLSLDQAPTVSYTLGPEGARLAFPLRFASLDALGHQHAAGDRHVLAAGYAARTGDLGGGRFGLDVPVGGAAPALAYPAEATRLLLQVRLADRSGESMVLDLPGGPTTVYPGEVLVRETAAPPQGFAITCTTCEGQQSLAQAQRAAPVPVEPEPLDQTATGGGNGPGRADVLAEAGFLFVLFAPAGIMLLGCIGYVMRHGGAWHSPEVAPPPASRPAARPAPQAQRGKAQHGAQPQRLQAGAPTRRV